MDARAMDSAAIQPTGVKDVTPLQQRIVQGLPSGGQFTDAHVNINDELIVVTESKAREILNATVEDDGQKFEWGDFVAGAVTPVFALIAPPATEWFSPSTVQVGVAVVLTYMVMQAIQRHRHSKLWRREKKQTVDLITKRLKGK